MARLWIDNLVNAPLGSGALAVQGLNGTFTTEATRLAQMTLLRTIIGLDVAYTVHDSGEGSQQVALGIGIAETDAFAAGVGSLPDPGVESDFPRLPWVWRARYRIFGFAADQPTIFTRRLDLDIRAQRKLGNGISYLILSNTPQEGVAATVSVTGYIRQLWLVG